MKKEQIKAAIFIGLSLFTITLAVYFYQIFYTSNLVLNKPKAYIYIPKGATIKDVVDSLKYYDNINDLMSFMFVSRLLGYNDKITSGRFELEGNMSNLKAVLHLKNGSRTPVKITFSNVRLVEQLQSIFCTPLAADGQVFDSLLHSPAFTKSLGFTPVTIGSMFIPETYFFDWPTTSETVFKRMKYEYDRFWGKNNRINKLKTMKMSKLDVSILASIVQAETFKQEEKPRIAGVYINRLRKNMLLQADPTVIFALQDFSIQRLLKKHLKYKSAYNTYLHHGLPPGPINIPKPSSIDAVLNYEKHRYLYFCAKDDLSGYHNFAVSYKQHQKNARLYHRSLSLRKK